MLPSSREKQNRCIFFAARGDLNPVTRIARTIYSYPGVPSKVYPLVRRLKHTVRIINIRRFMGGISHMCLCIRLCTYFERGDVCRFGGVYPGVGWVIWRSWDYLPSDLVQTVSYLGLPQTSMTLNFSRPAMQVVLQYYNVSMRPPLYDAHVLGSYWSVSTATSVLHFSRIFSCHYIRVAFQPSFKLLEYPRFSSKLQNQSMHYLPPPLGAFA